MRRTSNKAEIEEGTGNVFADLGYSRPEEALAKARLSLIITDIVKERELTQARAAELLGIDQPKVSRLMRGQVRQFSLERLIHFLLALDREVDIVVKPKGRKKSDSLTVTAL